VLHIVFGPSARENAVKSSVMPAAASAFSSSAYRNPGRDGAAEEQHGWTEGNALRLARGALLEEAAERRKPRAGPIMMMGTMNHPAGESRLRLTHVRIDRIARAAVAEIVGADALVEATSGCGPPADYADGDAATRCIDRRRDEIE